VYHKGLGGLIYFAGFGRKVTPGERRAAEQAERGETDVKTGRVMTCSKCGGKGHNARGCKEGQEESEG